jgi:hypothetical protein
MLGKTQFVIEKNKAILLEFTFVIFETKVNFSKDITIT